MTRSRHTGRSMLWAKLLLALLSPIAFVAFAELTIRVTGIDYELTRNDNFEIAIPAWLMADDNFAQNVQPGVKAENVAWLQYFTEARYIWTKLKPNVEVDAVNPFNDIEVEKGITFHFSSNSDGFRGRHFGPKEPSVIRIVCIGDSSTFGWGVDDEYTYPQLLESRLTRPGEPRVEVLNLGIPGFTSRHGLGVLKHYARDLEADFFVFSFGANDPRVGIRTVNQVLSEDDGWRGTVRFTALRFKTYQLLRKIAFDLYDPSERFREERPELVLAVSDFEYRQNLRELINLARTQGARPVLLAVCAIDLKVDHMRLVSEATKVPMVDALQLFLERLDDLKAHRAYPDEVRYSENIYGLPAMDENWRLYVSTDGCHPSRAGMSLIADDLAQIISEGALPR